MAEKITFTIAVFLPLGLCVAGALVGCLLEFLTGEDRLGAGTALGCLAALGVVIWLLTDPSVPKQPLRDAGMLWLIVIGLGGLVGSLAMVGAALMDCTPIVILVAMMVAAGIVVFFIYEYKLFLGGYQEVEELAQVAIRILQA